MTAPAPKTLVGLFPTVIPDLTPLPRRFELQRAASRMALQHCAAAIGAPHDGWMQNADGAPLPNQGWCWSVSHKPNLSAAAIAQHPVGVDVEHLRPRNEHLFGAMGKDSEWIILAGAQRPFQIDAPWPAPHAACSVPPKWVDFFRLWTAKEAVAKLHGKGIGTLHHIHLCEAPIRSVLRMRYLDIDHCVLQRLWGDHMIAVAAHSLEIDWLPLSQQQAAKD